MTRAGSVLTLLLSSILAACGGDDGSSSGGPGSGSAKDDDAGLIDDADGGSKPKPPGTRSGGNSPDAGASQPKAAAARNDTLRGTLFYAGPSGTLIGVDLATGLSTSLYPEAEPRSVSADARELATLSVDKDQSIVSVRLHQQDGTPEGSFMLDGAGAGSPLFSPDGKLLSLYLTQDDDSAELRVLTREGRTVARYADAVGPHAWLPDGRLVVSRTAELALSAQPITEAGPAPALTSLHRFDTVTPHSLSVSQSGARIAFALVDDKTSHLYVIGSDGNDLRQITAHRPDDIAPIGEYAPAFIGDDHLAFAYGKQVDNFWLTLPIPTAENPNPVVNPGPCGEIRVIPVSADKAQVWNAPEVKRVAATDAGGSDGNLACTFAPMSHRSAQLPAANEPGKRLDAQQKNGGVAGKLYYRGFAEGSSDESYLGLDLASGKVEVAVPGTFRSDGQTQDVFGFGISGDGKRIAVLSSYSDAGFNRYDALTISDWNGGNASSVVVLTDDTTFRGPVELNRDGSLVALRSLFAHQIEIYKREGEDLTLVTQVADLGAYDFAGDDLLMSGEEGLYKVKSGAGTSAKPELILPTSAPPGTFDVSPDGRDIVYSQFGHVWRRALDGSQKPVRVTVSGGIEYAPRFSPDGQWLIVQLAKDDLDSCSTLWLVPSTAHEVRLGDRQRDLYVQRVQWRPKDEWTSTNCAFSNAIWH